MDIATVVTRAAARFADRIAVDGPQGRQTFAELADRVTRLGRGLRSLGLRPGDRVLDLQTNQNTYLESDLAIRACGLVRVALNHRLHPGDWARIAVDCDARALIYDARFAAQTETLRRGIEHVVSIGDGPGTPYEWLLARQPARPLPAASSDALCGLHYSSGTTGHPKGAQRTHRNWIASLVNMTHDVLGGQPAAHDVYLHAGPITHTSGLFVLPFLSAGATQVILPAWDPESFMDAVRRHRVTHTALVPTMVSRLLAVPGMSRQRLAGLKMLGYAGAPMPPEQMRQAHEALTPRLVQYYGLVEAIPPVTVLDPADHQRGLSGDPDLLTSAGRPALTVDIRIVDDGGHDVPIGQIGEIATRGDHVMPGYWNAGTRPDLGKSIIDGWLRTGDLGHVDDRGYLWLVDRKGEMIISGGYNIYPREIEDVVAEVPGVHEVAVIGVADPDWGQRVVAFYTVRAGAGVTDGEILAHCAARLASYKKPKQLRRIDAFPLNSTGKIAKRLLQP